VQPLEGAIGIAHIGIHNRDRRGPLIPPAFGQFIEFGLVFFLSAQGIQGQRLTLDSDGFGAESSGDGRAATTLDLADDAAAAIAYLRDRPEIDSRRIAIIGHSEGGSIAALLSGGPRPPAACVSISGLITPFTEQMRHVELHASM
jgi:predicted alpha/beta hydrolase